MYLRNAWYQVGWAHELDGDGLLARTILEQPLILLRDAEGVAYALADMCPHRFAPLSRGRVENGKITCGYHGLQFDASGSCVFNPHGPPPKSARVTAYPVLEKHRALWVWMGDPDRADPAELPDLAFIDEAPAGGHVFGYLPTKANYLLVSDNIMDLSHADYLHASTLGGYITSAKVKLEEFDDRLFIGWYSADTPPPPAIAPRLPEGSRADIWTEVTWRAPALMCLVSGAVVAGTPRSREEERRTLHNVTPEGPDSCHYFYCQTRHFQVGDEEYASFIKKILDQAFGVEDKPMLEAQQRQMGNREFWSMRPVLLSVDKGPVLARRALERRIKAENDPVTASRALETQPA